MAALTVSSVKRTLKKRLIEYNVRTIPNMWQRRDKANHIPDDRVYRDDNGVMRSCPPDQYVRWRSWVLARQNALREEAAKQIIRAKQFRKKGRS